MPYVDAHLTPLGDGGIERPLAPWRRPGVRLRTFRALAIPVNVIGNPDSRGNLRDTRVRFLPGCWDNALDRMSVLDRQPRVVWAHHLSEAAGRAVEYGEITQAGAIDAGLVLVGVTCLPVEVGWGVSVGVQIHSTFCVPHPELEDVVDVLDIGLIDELSLLSTSLPPGLPGAMVFDVDEAIA